MALAGTDECPGGPNTPAHHWKDPWSSAYVILGSLESLGEFACRITALVARAVERWPATKED